MKTALIAGVCLLALTITTTDALSKKQNCDCIPDSELLACINGLVIKSVTICTEACKTALMEYYDNCVRFGADVVRQNYELLCDCGDDDDNGADDGDDGNDGDGSDNGGDNDDDGEESDNDDDGGDGYNGGDN